MVRSEGNVSLQNPVIPPGVDPGTARLVAQRLNHYATPGPLTPFIWIEKITLKKAVTKGCNKLPINTASYLSSLHYPSNVDRLFYHSTLCDWGSREHR
jgi:hypothetical protein